jgi:hypothetical protein
MPLSTQMNECKRTDSVNSRDHRIDFFRGLALVCIFIDHIPDNAFAYFTLRNFGFNDASEVFVLLAGISAALAYGQTFERDGLRAGVTRVASRLRQVYIAHLLLLIVCVGGLAMAAWALENPIYYDHINLTPFSDDPFDAIWRALILSHQPGYLNILPLYIVLLALLPTAILLARIHFALLLATSGALWFAAAMLRINLPSYSDDFGWYFNPLAWQLLFVIGLVVGIGMKRGLHLPRKGWAVGAALSFVVASVLLAAPWTNIPSLGPAYIVPWSAIGHISKTNLSILRIGNILALAYLAAAFIPASASWLRKRWACFFVEMGRHSLEVFATGTVLSFLAFGILAECGRSVILQIAVNVSGIALMYAVGKWKASRKARTPCEVSVATCTPPREFATVKPMPAVTGSVAG